MTIDELQDKLNEVKWEEFLNFRMEERFPNSTEGLENIEELLLEIGQQLTSDTLDRLEQTPGYIAWSLRLSQYVSDDDSKHRAQRYLNHDDREIQFWAHRLIEGQ